MVATANRESSASLSVTPSRAAYDADTAIDVAGLAPGTAVTVRARMPEPDGIWSSWATFEADDAGTVDLTEHAPVAGTYEGVDPMGLFWSMSRERDAELAADDDRIDSTVVEISAEVDGETVATAEFERVYLDGVDRTRIDERGLVAEFYRPTAEGPHPGVVLLGGADGGYPPWKPASLLASEGFAVCSLAYFGVQGRPDALEGIRLEYVTDALDWLAGRDCVRGGRLGIVGWSRGANLALLVAVRNPVVGTVVAYAPSGVVFGGIPDGFYEAGSPWSDGGSPLPYVPFDFGASFPLRAASRWIRRDRLSMAPIYERSLAAADERTRRRATIPVEEADCGVLLHSGGDDEMWSSRRFCRRIVDRLDDCNYEHPYEHASYPDAGHSIPVPNDPVGDDTLGTFVRGLPLAAGGSPAANARAATDAWQATLDHLTEGLRP